MPDSLHRTTTGHQLRFDAGPDTEIDPGPWGQTKLIQYRPSFPNQAPDRQTVVEGSITITPETGEPELRTFTLSILPAVAQPPGVENAGGRGDIANVHLVAFVDYGIGGAAATAEISVKRGTSFTCPASSWRISAFIEPMPDMSEPWMDPVILYPNDTTGPKTVAVFCSVALGTRQGGAVLPTRDMFLRTEPMAVSGQPYSYPIPASAIALQFYASDGNPNAALVNGHWIGAHGGEIGLINFNPGIKNEIPAGATHVAFDEATGQPSRLITMAWDIFL